MTSDFVLPLFPLDDTVLFPGGRVRAGGRTRMEREAVAESQAFGDRVVASLKDGESVHEVGVTAVVAKDEQGLQLCGLGRCRLVELIRDDPPMVKAETFPDRIGRLAGRAAPVSRLLGSRFNKLCDAIGRSLWRAPAGAELSALTWTVAAGLGLSVDQQQGFLNVPDPVTRGRLLLAAVRELERRERFLRPWAHLRQTAGWN